MDLPPRARRVGARCRGGRGGGALDQRGRHGRGAPPPQAIGLAALLAVLSVAHTELATGIERARRRVAQSSYFDLSSVWTFAGALLLPPPLAAAVVVVVYAHLWQRVWRPSGVPLHRHVYTTATVVLAATAAHEVVTGAGGLPSDPADVAGALGVVAAVLAYVVVNTVLIAVAIGLSRHATDARELMGRWDDNALEIATLCLGGLAAVALGGAPFLVALALPPILVLHRAVRVRHLEEAASLDGKTGLLNAATWRARAEPRGRDARGPGGRGRAHRRPRPLQGGQRPARPPRGRRRARRGRRGAAVGGARARTSSAGSAGRSSSCSSGRCRGDGRAGRARRRRPSGCAGRSPRLTVPALGRRRDRRAHGVGGRGVRRAGGGPRRGAARGRRLPVRGEARRAQPGARRGRRGRRRGARAPRRRRRPAPSRRAEADAVPSSWSA